MEKVPDIAIQLLEQVAASIIGRYGMVEVVKGAVQFRDDLY